MTDTRDTPFADGAAYIDGAFMPVRDARIPITDWGYRRSDVTYDVVGVWNGSFFRLDDHVARFRRSMQALRMDPAEDDARIRAILHECVRLSGLRNAYVAMDCLRGRPLPGQRFHPATCRNYIAAFAIPWVWVIPPEIQERGAHLIIASALRIPDRSVDPTVKNFHWGDLTQGLFEAGDRGADTCVLLDADGHVTEGAGFNVFAVIAGAVVTPDRGALEGITRASVAELCRDLGLEYCERPITAQELRGAEEIFLSTTAGGIMPVSRIDDIVPGDDRPGPVSMRLRDLFWAKRAAGWHATPVAYGDASS
ncbi:aminotransferase class IV [Gluconacetobacter tumulisoli]|uniref:Probable branched-chain-amino-acid aminotransferase n=1 Tax=Gluconacetobacter tumulisoli TaxID=1286189 RepID=A0A7W4K828_9PROT|nr:aminotransferase class IV [Gluconacetobacter tumulisoli]MBB2202122.1 branched-chain amino acid--2-keto-4-methylthiobutyrate aminotransferase [Gluconacetobacter tumulisoli]